MKEKGEEGGRSTEKLEERIVGEFLLNSLDFLSASEVLLVKGQGKFGSLRRAATPGKGESHRGAVQESSNSILFSGD